MSKVVAALPLEDGFGRPLDRVGRAEPAAGGRRDGRRSARWRAGIAQGASFSRTSAGALPSKTIRAGIRIVMLVGAFADLVEPAGRARRRAARHHLERAVAFDRAGGVVVDAFAGAREAGAARGCSRP